MGEKGFQGLYSVLAIASLTWAVVVFGRSPRAPLLWDGHQPAAWIVASVLTITATALFAASFDGNPALPGARVAGLSAIMPKGVFLVTRHPMMWAFALWALAHVVVAPSPRVLVLMGGMIALALGGAHLQDRKKDKLNGRDWRAWMRRTPFWPDLRRLPALGGYWAVALLAWLFVTWLHLPLAHEPAGVWWWLTLLQQG